MKPKDEKVCRAILLTWDSVSSHIRGLRVCEEMTASQQRWYGNVKFHKKCIREYAEIIKTLADVL